jgi:hypothetical protein
MTSLPTGTRPVPSGDASGSETGVDRADAIITLAYYDADGRLVDSEELHVSPDAGSIWIKPSASILSWPAVRTVRASLDRTPETPVDIDVHLLPPSTEHRSVDVEVVHPA